MLRSRWRDRIRLGALAVVAFVLAHDLVFLLTDGGSYGLGLTRTGHGDQWTGTVLLVAALALALTILGAARLLSLSRLARSLDGGQVTVQAGGPADLGRHLVRAWLTILPIALLLFVGVENVEHLSVGLPLPALSVLGSTEYHSVIGVFALISLVAALVDGLYRWRRDLLVARIEAARTRLRHGPAAVGGFAFDGVDRRHASIAGNRISGRAPPRLALA